MKRKIKILTAWILLVMTVLFIVSGYAMKSKYGFDLVMPRETAKFLHKNMIIPYLILLAGHVLPYVLKKKS